MVCFKQVTGGAAIDSRASRSHPASPVHPMQFFKESAETKKEVTYCACGCGEVIRGPADFYATAPRDGKFKFRGCSERYESEHSLLRTSPTLQPAAAP